MGVADKYYGKSYAKENTRDSNGFIRLHPQGVLNLDKDGVGRQIYGYHAREIAYRYQDRDDLCGTNLWCTTWKYDFYYKYYAQLKKSELDQLNPNGFSNAFSGRIKNLISVHVREYAVFCDTSGTAVGNYAQYYKNITTLEELEKAINNIILHGYCQYRRSSKVNYEGNFKWNDNALNTYNDQERIYQNISLFGLYRQGSILNWTGWYDSLIERFNSEIILPNKKIAKSFDAKKWGSIIYNHRGPMKFRFVTNDDLNKTDAHE